MLHLNLQGVVPAVRTVPEFPALPLIYLQTPKSLGTTWEQNTLFSTPFFNA